MDDFGFGQIINSKADFESVKEKLEKEDPSLFKEIYGGKKSENIEETEDELFDRITNEALEEMTALHTSSSNSNSSSPAELYNEEKESELLKELGIQVAKVPIKNEGNCDSSLFQTVASMIEIELRGTV